ncbi:hypothetical protein Ocin01_00147 [Orchesella cincta]|uniref:SHSP domain-containing protein n=1 Tax=Orchesella cincta TaxID=48709 RepID=A0A1D2NMP5_ORCCI|nr:hypothetical protein Ocin01_00147 [Orchesella cincta]
MADQTVDQFLSLGPTRRQVPTIQQLGKNNKAHPPGHTPIGSLTDMTALDTDTDGPPALITSNPTTEPGNEAEDDQDHCHSSRITTPGGAVDGDDEGEEPRMRSPPSPGPEQKKQQSMRLKDSNSNIIVPSSSTTLADDESFVNFMHQDVWSNMSKSLTPLVANLGNRRTRSFSTFRRRQPRNTATSEDSITTASSRAATTTTGTDSDQSFVRQYYNFGNFGSLTSSNITEPLSQSGQSQVSSAFSVKAARKREQDFPNLNKVINKLQETEVFFDREAAVRGLKQRILRGERVTHEEIKAIRNLTVTHSQRHKGYRLPWSKDLYCVKGLVHIPTPNKPSPLVNSFASTDDLRIPVDDKITLEHWGRRQYVLNLAGFNDEDISLYLEGKNKLVIRAVRPDRRDHPAMSITETIMLPPDLAADNLRIARLPNGTTIIEESWRF